MMQLKDASLLGSADHRMLRGAIYGDTRGRFNDGEYVITSRVISHAGNVYKTLNSTYEVEFATTPKKAVWVPDDRGAYSLEASGA